MTLVVSLALDMILKACHVDSDGMSKSFIKTFVQDTIKCFTLFVIFNTSFCHLTNESRICFVELQDIQITFNIETGFCVRHLYGVQILYRIKLSLYQKVM